MKKIMLSLVSGILLCTAFTLSNEPAKEILGAWKIDESSIASTAVSIIKVLRKDNPETADALEQQFEMLKDYVRQIRIEYKPDNTYEINTPEGPQYGKWVFIENNKYLLIKRDGKDDRKDVVLEISPTQLKLINPERADTTLYIRP